MHYIHTASGNKFVYGADKYGMSPEDVAHHLSGVTRFCGATRWAYSVGQHSLLTERLMGLIFPDAPIQWRLHALIHDCHEGVMSDIPTPFERWFTENFCGGVSLIERAKACLDNQMMPALGVNWPVPEEQARAVKVCDKYAFVVEARQLFLDIPEWLEEYIDAYGFRDIAHIDISLPHMIQSEVREAFLSKWNELIDAQKEERRLAS